MATFGKTDNTTAQTGAYASGGSETMGSGGLLTTGGTLTAVRVFLASIPSFRNVRLAVYQGGSLAGTNGDPTNAALIWDSGELLTTLASGNTINAATKAAQCVVTCSATPNFVTGDRMIFPSIGSGMTQLSLTNQEVVSVSGNDVTLNVDSTAFGTWSGTASVNPARWYQISASGTLVSSTNTWLMVRSNGAVRWWTSAASSDFTSGTGADSDASGNHSNDVFQDPYPRDWNASINASQQVVGAIVYTPSTPAGGMTATRGMTHLTGGMIDLT